MTVYFKINNIGIYSKIVMNGIYYKIDMIGIYSKIDKIRTYSKSYESHIRNTVFRVVAFSEVILDCKFDQIWIIICFHLG